jgi:hypothetical protein
MNPLFRGHTLGWIVVLAATLVSLFIVSWRLSGLPELGVFLGPDLTVRAVRTDRAPGSDVHQFQRGDRLVAIQRQAVDDLRDVRSVLPHFPAHGDMLMPEERPEDAPAADGMASMVLIDYQIMRPLHRFSLALQGEVLDPTELPPGVEPTDRLVELDGRLLPGRVGPEGLRSIVASRPDALLGLERVNAVFSGQIKVPQPSWPFGVLASFSLAFFIIMLLWRYHGDWFHPTSVWAIGVETFCLAWVYLIAFQYQWIIADYLLATAVIFGLILLRPLSIYARERASTEGGHGGRIALGLGLCGAVLTAGLMYGNYLPNAEVALHMAAMIAGLFIIYELVVTGFERGSAGLLGEKGGYLSGIVVLSLLACVVASLMEPVAFEEDRWRWFAVLVPSMVWFGDVLFCVRQSGSGNLTEIADDAGRARALEHYLRTVGREMPQTSLKLVLYWEDRTIVISLLGTEIVVAPASQALHDAMGILVQENARVPLPETHDRHQDPMTGIAQTMNMVLALRLTPPPGAVVLDDLAIVVVGINDHKVGELGSYASLETLDLVQKQLSSAVWAAAILKAMPAFARESPGADAQAIADKVKAERARLAVDLEKATGRIEELEERVSILQEDFQALRARDELLKVVDVLDGPPLALCQRLLEPELLEGLSYLLESDEPYALSGAIGSGKSFVARCAHLLEGGRPEDFFVLDCAAPGVNERIAGLLGFSDGQGALLEYVGDGTLLIKSAEHLGDQAIELISHKALALDVRVVFAFHAPDAEERSPLAERDELVEEILGHREVVIPSLVRRPSVLREVLMSTLAESARRREKRIDGFSRKAMEALEAYSYPGQFIEARYVVDTAVLRAAHDVVDLEDLPLDLRSRKG